MVTCATGSPVLVAVGSRVAVSVGRGGGVGVKTAAVKVNCETTVLAAEVRTAATSGVGAAGVAGDPQAASSRTTMRESTASLFFIVYLTTISR